MLSNEQILGIKDLHMFIHNQLIQNVNIFMRYAWRILKIETNKKLYIEIIYINYINLIIYEILLI